MAGSLMASNMILGNCSIHTKMARVDLQEGREGSVTILPKISLPLAGDVIRYEQTLERRVPDAGEHDEIHIRVAI